MTTLMPPVQDPFLTVPLPSSRDSHRSQGPDHASVSDAMQHRPVAGWQMQRTATIENRVETGGTAADAAVDIMALLGRCLGNFELIVRVLARFRKSGATDVEQIGVAIERSDFASVVAIAHRFKGASGNISAAGLHRVAARMEHLGRDQNARELSGLFAQLRVEWEEFLRFADAFAPPGSASPVQPVK